MFGINTLIAQSRVSCTAKYPGSLDKGGSSSEHVRVALPTISVNKIVVRRSLRMIEIISGLKNPTLFYPSNTKVRQLYNNNPCAQKQMAIFIFWNKGNSEMKFSLQNIICILLNIKLF